MSYNCWVLSMKKTAYALTIVLTISIIFGVQFVHLVQANGMVNVTYNGSPIITIKSPLNNKLVSSNTVVVSFTLTRPSDNWFIGEASCAVSGVRIVVDEVCRSVAVNSELLVPFSYSLNLTDLQNGLHSLQLNAYCRGIRIRYGLPTYGNEEYIYYETLSDTVSFTVDAPEPSPEPTSTPILTPTPPPETTSESATFQTNLFLASSAGIALGVAGLLVYFMKRKH
jgi:hypothetical protein